jgi:hypothetical protein
MHYYNYAATGDNMVKCFIIYLKNVRLLSMDLVQKNGINNTPHITGVLSVLELYTQNFTRNAHTSVKNS